MKQVLRFRWFLLPIPFLLGVYGYLLIFDGNILGSIYSAIRLYGLNVDVAESDINIYIQIARWLAILATTSVIALLFQRISNEIIVRWKLRTPDSVVIHGTGPRSEFVASNLGEHAILMEGKACLGAKKHILAFENDSLAISYLQEHEQSLLGKDKKEIFFLSNEYEESDYVQNDLIVSNSAMNCARLYWKKHWINDAGISKIAIIGFGKYAEHILTQGLLVNMAAWHPPLEYHIYGSTGAEFLRWHPHLQKSVAIDLPDSTRDSVYFHSCIEDAGFLELSAMDRIIISMDDVDKNILFLNRIISAGINGDIHIRCNHDLLSHMQYVPNCPEKEASFRIVTFGEDRELYSDEVIMRGKLSRTAKNIHVNYVRNATAEDIRKKYFSCRSCTKTDICGNCMRAVNTWDDLSPFEKASNIAAADHIPVKLHMLLMAGEKSESDFKYELCRVEHERWCRFHYMYNWKYGEYKDSTQRTHPSLRPYGELSPSEQEKDWWGYQQLLDNVDIHTNTAVI